MPSNLLPNTYTDAESANELEAASIAFKRGESYNDKNSSVYFI